MKPEDILKPVVIEGDKAVNAFLDAVDASMKDRDSRPPTKPKGRQITDPEELKQFMQQAKKKRAEEKSESSNN